MAGATSALFLLDMKGRCLISRDYRGDVSAQQVEKFFSKLLEKEVYDYVVHDHVNRFNFIVPIVYIVLFQFVFLSILTSQLIQFYEFSAFGVVLLNC